MTAAKKQMSEIFAGRDRARLAKLRTADPSQNLAARWKKIVEARPDIAERRLAYVPLIAQHRWVVIAIPEEGFAYTIGLKYHFDQPELLIAAPSLDPGELKQLLNALGMYISLGNRIAAGEPVDLVDFGVSLTFKPYSHAVFGTYATGYLASFECFFEDLEHETGDTLPVLWTELTEAAAPKPKKGAPKKTVAKKTATKKTASKKTTKAAPKKTTKAAPKKTTKAAPKKPTKAAPKKTTKAAPAKPTKKPTARG